MPTPNAKTGLWLPILTALCLLGATGCGSLLTEEWKGDKKNCRSGSNSSNRVDEVMLILDGPVTASPTGSWRESLGGGSWAETDIQDSSYIGPTLRFKTEYRMEFLGITTVTITEFELTRKPGALEGTAVSRSDHSETTCDIVLKPSR